MLAVIAKSEDLEKGQHPRSDLAVIPACAMASCQSLAFGEQVQVIFDSIPNGVAGATVKMGDFSVWHGSSRLRVLASGSFFELLSQIRSMRRVQFGNSSSKGKVNFLPVPFFERLSAALTHSTRTAAVRDG